MSVRPSFRPSLHLKQLGSHWTDFNEIVYLSSFKKSVDKIEVLLKSDKKNGHFTWKGVQIYDTILLNSS
jgi:hypothetical protein